MNTGSYKTDNLVLSPEVVDGLRGELNKNGWFQHFKYHLSDVDTWIDFETEIENTLMSLLDLFLIEFTSEVTAIPYMGNLNRHDAREELLKQLDGKAIHLNKTFFESKINFRFDKINHILYCFYIFQNYYVKAKKIIEKNALMP